MLSLKEAVDLEISRSGALLILGVSIGRAPPFDPALAVQVRGMASQLSATDGYRVAGEVTSVVMGDFDGDGRLVQAGGYDAPRTRNGYRG
jgi:hypothetical protein